MSEPGLLSVNLLLRVLAGLLTLAALYRLVGAARINGRLSWALAGVFAGWAWQVCVITLSSYEAMVDFLPCMDLRGVVFRHVWVVWLPVVVASAWLVHELYRRDP